MVVEKSSKVAGRLVPVWEPIENEARRPDTTPHL
jgi:hypothetical protein